LVACLAVSDRPLPRSLLAGKLWPDVPEGRALARLRSALWRLPEPDSILLDKAGDSIALRESVTVDVDVLTGLALQILDGPVDVLEGRATPLLEAGELLPGWDEEWLVSRRERFRELRLHALEHIADCVAASGQFGRAVELCLTVLSEDPFRESAQRLLVRTFTAEGNLHAALAQYRRYRDLMRADLGLAPSAQMEDLIARLPIAEGLAALHVGRSKALSQPARSDRNDAVVRRSRVTRR
jgi:DNA-binding SARP family transcriptional activator